MRVVIKKNGEEIYAEEFEEDVDEVVVDIEYSQQAREADNLSFLDDPRLTKGM